MTMRSSRRLGLPCCSRGPWPVLLDDQLAPSRSRHALSVVAPYRLDLTVSALRRLSTNVVDVLMPDGEYGRALAGAHGPVIVRAIQARPDALDVTIESDARDPGVASHRVDRGHHVRHLAHDERRRGDLVKVMSWYDNEWGYANQMLRGAV